jgi:hypothetical protein
MTQLAVNAEIVRVYADAVRKVFGPTLDRDDATGEMVHLLLSLADATAACAENIAQAQAQILELADTLGIEPKRPRFDVIDGGKI